MAFEKIKNSKLRSSIEQMLVDGHSPREISKFCKEHGESISYVTILSYRKEEFDFHKAAAFEMELIPSTSEEIFEQGKRSIIADIAYCNKVIEIAEKKVDEILDDEEKIGQFKTFHDAAMRAMEMKHKYAVGRENETIINYNHFDLREIEGQIKREIAELEELKTIEVKAVSGQ